MHNDTPDWNLTFSYIAILRHKKNSGKRVQKKAERYHEFCLQNEF
ncbi:hypothetical protein Lpp120_2362 [Lacticaseibacillus paracasei subsp. paracasei Lpp120]|nr:Hypothetical protein LOCK919_1361 [Lacticaseibacillus paracasei]EPC21591.1 hypothetical protein Lpp226_0874 [Lacticaseibacillus paracasei subsp. paracasei Lpp226]EPC28096.1 hypothetical protein Lpp46_0621 [Lacticaseibacillus paracasei subsp. paracasei Lpp46]EPC30389.1 hypothetical protein Lpp120_2362 [Lacticaseibacillus paracasei subsp. paracasei Lpp120]EPC34825.1 hypothetical protein Lpp223_0932 [Lacticaseibacillus paracasei subsp. paracasei Lpp223]